MDKRIKNYGWNNKATYIIAGLMMLYGAGGMTEDGKNFFVGIVTFAAGFAIIMAVSILPAIMSRSNKRKVSKKYLRYSSVIGQYRTTPVKMLADELRTSERNVKLDIQEMIVDGYLKDAYVDQESNELVVPVNKMIREKKVRCPKCSAQIKEYYNYCPVCGCSRNTEEASGSEEDLEKIRMYLGMISSVRLFSANQELVQCTAYFGELVSGILKRTEDKPKLMEEREIHNLFCLYLPKIAGALENYKEMMLQKIPADKRLAVEDDLCRVLYKENMALVEITNKLNDDDILDISTEIDAIARKLARDGYSQSSKGL